jgi:hypothetical protein
MSPLAERFAEAVHALVSDGPVKQRLCRAYSDYLEGLDQGELPTALRATFSELEAALTRVGPVGTETRVRASVQKMSPREAGEHAGTIVKLYVGLLLGQTERAEPLKVVTATKPPRYLTGRS